MPATAKLKQRVRDAHAADREANGAATLKAQQSARALVYQRLAEAFRLPGPGLTKLGAELEAALGHLDSGARACACALRACAETPLEELQSDHTALFVGPFRAPAPPYGSVYLENQRLLMNASTAAVRSHYLSQGLDLREDFKQPPDHICAELEFMHVLVCQSRLAIAGCDGAWLADSLRQQRSFLTAHLGVWVPDFASQVRAHAQTEFYRLLGQLTETFIAEEIEALPEV